MLIRVYSFITNKITCISSEDGNLESVTEISGYFYKISIGVINSTL